MLFLPNSNPIALTLTLCFWINKPWCIWNNKPFRITRCPCLQCSPVICHFYRRNSPAFGCMAHYNSGSKYPVSTDVQSNISCWHFVESGSKYILFCLCLYSRLGKIVVDFAYSVAYHTQICLTNTIEQLVMLASCTLIFVH